MKLSSRFYIINIIFSFVFLLQLFNIFFWYNKAVEIKEISLELRTAYNEVLTLEKDIAIIQYEPGKLEINRDDLSSSYYNFNSYMERDGIDLLDRAAEIDEEVADLCNSVKSTWDSLLESNYYSLTVESLNSLITGYNFETIDQLTLSYNWFMEKVLVQESVAAKRATTNINSLLIQVSNVLREYEKLSTKTDEIALTNSSRMLYTVLLSTLIMAIIAAISGILFANNISKNIKILDNSIAQISSGEFQLQIAEAGPNEFVNIARYFNELTSMLWFKLDSLKDIMRDIANSIEEETKIDDLLDFILELAADSTGADSGAAYLFDKQDNSVLLARTAGHYPPPMKVPLDMVNDNEQLKEWLGKQSITSNTVGPLGQCISSNDPVFIKNNIKDHTLPTNMEENNMFINSAFFLPLVTSGELVGILSLAITDKERHFSDLDFTYIKSFADFVALTLDNFFKYQELVKKHEISREIEVAADIQKSLLPERMPNPKGLEMAAFSYAAKGVSGDYYDAFKLDKNRIAVTVCDVSGKGVPASLFMVMIRTVLRTIASPGKSAGDTMKEMNQELSGNFRTGTFATIALLIIDINKNYFSYANGAHHPLYLYRKSENKYVKFDAAGLPLGIDVHTDFENKYIKVSKGDWLFLFTDGINEARNKAGDELGTNRMLKFASQWFNKSAKDMSNNVDKFLHNYTKDAGQHDDETFLTIKIK